MLLMLLMLLMEQVMVSMMLPIARIVVLVSGASHKQEAGSVTLHLVMVTDYLGPYPRSNILVQQLSSFRFLLLIIRQDSTLL